MRAGLVAVAAALLLFLPGMPTGSAAMNGCEVREGVYTCGWSFSDEDLASVNEERAFDLPVFPLTIGIFEVELVGRDNGWTLLVQFQNDTGEWETLSRSTHAATTDASYRHKQTSAFVIFGGSAHRVLLEPRFSEEFNAVAAGPRSAGRWSLTYNGERVPAGEEPSRPAADAAHPQLRDLRADTQRWEHDILGAWFTDDVLDDGLLEVHMELAALAEDMDFKDALGLDAERIGWKLAWRLGETTYFVEWIARPGEEGAGFTCQLRSEVAQGQTEPVLANPACQFDLESARLHAVFPERSIGSPRPGEVFAEPAARTRVYPLAQADPDVVDDATVPEFLFAMGGPAVWAELDGGALGPASAPWYQAPLSRENFVDTVQVFASALAAATFLVGLFIVGKRRRRTNALLHRVDDSIRGNVDSKETLLRLGRLETDFSEMYRRGRLTEGQYQVLSQRIATVATRHALRHSLGLDDGVPGDATPVRIDVADGPKKRIRP